MQCGAACEQRGEATVYCSVVRLVSSVVRQHEHTCETNSNIATENTARGDCGGGGWNCVRITDGDGIWNLPKCGRQEEFWEGKSEVKFL